MGTVTVVTVAEGGSPATVNTVMPPAVVVAVAGQILVLTAGDEVIQFSAMNALVPGLSCCIGRTLWCVGSGVIVCASGAKAPAIICNLFRIQYCAPMKGKPIPVFVSKLKSFAAMRNLSSEYPING
jgi:hypothetical protein